MNKNRINRFKIDQVLAGEKPVKVLSDFEKSEFARLQRSYKSMNSSLAPHLGRLKLPWYKRALFSVIGTKSIGKSLLALLALTVASGYIVFNSPSLQKKTSDIKKSTSEATAAESSKQAKPAVVEVPKKHKLSLIQKSGKSEIEFGSEKAVFQSGDRLNIKLTPLNKDLAYPYVAIFLKSAGNVVMIYPEGYEDFNPVFYLPTWSMPYDYLMTNDEKDKEISIVLSSEKFDLSKAFRSIESGDTRFFQSQKAKLEVFNKKIFLNVDTKMKNKGSN